MKPITIKRFLKENPRYTEEDCVRGIWLLGKRKGTYLEWFANGQLKICSSWKDKYNYSEVYSGWQNGIRHGLTERWYENGQMQEHSQWENGERNGLLKKWYPNGHLINRINYKNGKRHGVVEWWHTNGNKMEYSIWINGMRTADVKEWDEKGKLLDRHYEYSPNYPYKTYSEKRRGRLYIQLGCYTLTFKRWEKDWYNNPLEFPMGAIQTKAREDVYLAHCRFWKKKSFLEEEE